MLFIDYHLMNHSLLRQLTPQDSEIAQESSNLVIKTMTWVTLMFIRPKNCSEFDLNQVKVVLGAK
jgi:hypothetical protein